MSRERYPSVRYPRLKTWACSQPPPRVHQRASRVLMLQLHRPLHFSIRASRPSDNWPVLAQHADEASVFLCRCGFRLFSCTWPCPSPHRCLLQPTRVPLSDGCASALAVFSPLPLACLPDLRGVPRRYISLLFVQRKTGNRKEGALPPTPEGAWV